MAALSSQSPARVGAASTERSTVKRPEEKPRRRGKPPTLSPGDKIGAWRVEAELGRGGMGSVYAVTHCGFGKRAALKLCHRSVLGADFTIDTFLREARVVHLVDHPGVPDVFATGTYDCRPYLAMERLHGQTLGQLVDDRRLAYGEALDMLFEICRVLCAAHAAGVVHRDIKLDNVFITDAQPPQVKILDWGVARIVGEPDPLAGMIAGTLTYVAPEQIRADDVTPAGDIYSLGVLAYVLLFGRPPFRHERDLELIRMHLQQPPPQPSHLWPEIPSSLETLLVAMLAKEAEKRPSIDDVLAGIVAARRAIRPRETSRSEATLPIKPPIDVLGRPAPIDLGKLLRQALASPRRLIAAILALGALTGTISTLFGG